MNRKTWAYIIGVALGDGNLSNPNGRAVRLRVTCDAKYPEIAQQIIDALRQVLPSNAVSVVHSPHARSYFNISVYSNQLSIWMPWTAGAGTKHFQDAHVPAWILRNRTYAKECLRGLLQTDGSIYVDRTYTMVNFCNNTKSLAIDVHTMLCSLGYSPTFSETRTGRNPKYTVRIARDSKKLISDIRLIKR